MSDCRRRYSQCHAPRGVSTSPRLRRTQWRRGNITAARSSSRGMTTNSSLAPSNLGTILLQTGRRKVIDRRERIRAAAVKRHARTNSTIHRHTEVSISILVTRSPGRCLSMAESLVARNSFGMASTLSAPVDCQHYQCRLACGGIGQARWIGGTNVRRQIQIIQKLFESPARECDVGVFIGPIFGTPSKL
jgi:hypothetical protein